MSHNFQLDKLYKIKFYDHAVGLDEAIICEVAGWVIKDTEQYVVLTSWVCHSEDEQLKKDNVEQTVIVKSCIVRKRKLG